MPVTGIVKDSIYLKHHTMDGHPETAERLRSIYKLLSEDTSLKNIRMIKPRIAQIDDLLLFHKLHYIERVKIESAKPVSFLDMDTVVSRHSFDVACHAVGGVLEVIDAIMKNEIANAFVLCRPPGHHAEPAKGMGFCIFNNVSIGAAYALKKYSMERILIVDWDLHHGNGTQDFFYDDPRVLYFSIHEFPSYPGSGRIEEIGMDRGRGYTINVPLFSGLGDSEYVMVIENILKPVAMEFSPQLILVSAGFDPYHGDPLGGMRLTEEGFAFITKQLMDIADECCSGRLILVLEGGYSIEGIGRCVREVIRQLTGSIVWDENEIVRFIRNSQVAIGVIIRRVRDVLRPYWPCFQ